MYKILIPLTQPGYTAGHLGQEVGGVRGRAVALGKTDRPGCIRFLKSDEIGKSVPKKVNTYIIINQNVQTLFFKIRQTSHMFFNVYKVTISPQYLLYHLNTDLLCMWQVSGKLATKNKRKEISHMSCMAWKKNDWFVTFFTAWNRFSTPDTQTMAWRSMWGGAPVFFRLPKPARGLRGFQIEKNRTDAKKHGKFWKKVEGWFPIRHRSGRHLHRCLRPLS